MNKKYLSIFTIIMFISMSSMSFSCAGFGSYLNEFMHHTMDMQRGYMEHGTSVVSNNLFSGSLIPNIETGMSTAEIVPQSYDENAVSYDENAVSSTSLHNSEPVTNALSSDSLSTNTFTSDSLSTNALSSDSLSTNALSSDSLSTNPYVTGHVYPAYTFSDFEHDLTTSFMIHWQDEIEEAMFQEEGRLLEESVRPQVDLSPFCETSDDYTPDNYNEFYFTYGQEKYVNDGNGDTHRMGDDCDMF